MDLVLPQIGSFRPVESRSASPLKEEVLSLTIKPVELKGPLPGGEPIETLAGHDVLKHPRRFQALVSPIPATLVAPVEEGTETLSELDIPKHPRRFQALTAAGPAKVANRFSRREPTAESAAEPSLQDPSATPEAPAETGPLGPQIQLPKAVLAALARAADAPSNMPIPSAILDGAARKSKELRGVPPAFQERRNSRTIYDW